MLAHIAGSLLSCTLQLRCNDLAKLRGAGCGVARPCSLPGYLSLMVGMGFGRMQRDIPVFRAADNGLGEAPKIERLSEELVLPKLS